MISDYTSKSILGRAQKNKKITVKTINPRDFTTDNHKTVDDRPYGGGVGMVMMIEPLYKAWKFLKLKENKSARGGRGTRTILLSAKGKTWNQEMARSYLKKYDHLVFVCGRYEGVDQRVDEFIDEEISVGDYVLTGGELPALTIVDSITRLISGVLGKDESSHEESHSTIGYKEYPQYTRPEVFKIGRKKLKVPEILLSGDHKKIKEWRSKS